MYLSENFIIYVAFAAILILAVTVLISSVYGAYKRYKAMRLK